MAADAVIAKECSSDPLDDLAGYSRQIIPEERIDLVSPTLQRDALSLVARKKFTKLTLSQAKHFVGKPPSPGLTPYLIRACFVAVAPPKTANGFSNPARIKNLERAVDASAFDVSYIPEKKTLTAVSFGLAPRDRPAGPVAFVVWSEGPIADVRIFAGGAE